MGEQVFLDTNGWIALLNARDQLHESAAQSWQTLGGSRIVVSDWIIGETGNGLARTSARAAFVEAVARIQRSPRAEIAVVTSDLREQALARYASHADKSWGLIDCASFEIMRERGIQDAFTNDRHFTQAGFHCLLAIP